MHTIMRKKCNNIMHHFMHLINRTSEFGIENRNCELNYLINHLIILEI